MELLAEKRLVTGENLKVFHWCAPEKAPRKFADYVSASFGSDHPHRDLYTINGWRAYFSDSMNGALFPDVVDHWFFAEVDGECAGRIWFAYSARTGRGNFGNVMTEPAYQRRGIMTELMKHCMAEIRRSPAVMLCCATGNKFAAASYIKFGFYLIYGGETGPLCFSKGKSFLDEAKQVFSGGRTAEIRPGEIGDQFDLDKFLAYTPELWKRALPVQCGPSASISDFRLAYQESVGGRGVVFSSLNDDGQCCGYAFAVLLSGLPVLDFMIHPACREGAGELIRRTAAAFREKFHLDPLYYGHAADEEKNSLLREAGMKQTAVIPNGIFWRMQPADMTVWTF